MVVGVGVVVNWFRFLILIIAVVTVLLLLLLLLLMILWEMTMMKIDKVTVPVLVVVTEIQMPDRPCGPSLPRS